MPPSNLQLLAKQIVEGFLIGLHKSPFHGFSVEFAEHRQYNRGDNLKHVDWKAYGRTEKMFIKKFEEETNLRCCLALDTSSSMQFRSNGWSKLEFSAVIAASLIQLMKTQMDASSLALFDEHLYSLSPAKTGITHTGILINELERVISVSQPQKQTRLAESLHELAERLHRRSLVVVFSDAPILQDEASTLIDALQHLRFNKHEVLFFHVLDKEKEMDLDYENRPYTFEDMETGQTIQLNPGAYREVFVQKIQEYKEYIKNRCLEHNIDYVFCDLQTDPSEILHQYLIKRNKIV